MKTHGKTWRGRVIILGALVCGIPTPSDAAQHLIDVNEIYSNEDGSVQYVELVALSSFQSVLAPTSIRAFNADGTMENTFFDFTSSYAGFGSNSAGLTLLVATPGFEAAFGFAPDFVAQGPLFSTDGRVLFFQESGGCFLVPDCEIDAIAYGNYTGDNGVHGDPAPPLPRDGCMSLTRFGSSNQNNVAWAVMPATPTRTDGTTGSPGPALCAPVDMPFIRGDADGSGDLNALVDALLILNFAFLSGRAPDCEKTADVNGDGTFNGIADSLDLLNFGFLSGPPPAAPFPDCGLEPIVTPIACTSYACP